MFPVIAWMALSQALLISLRAHTGQLSAEYLRVSLHILGVLALCSSLFSGTLSTELKLPCPLAPSQPRESMGSACISLAFPQAWQPFQGRKVGQSIQLISFVSCLSLPFLSDVLCLENCGSYFVHFLLLLLQARE